jgi:hypothetical protein
MLEGGVLEGQRQHIRHRLFFVLSNELLPPNSCCPVCRVEAQTGAGGTDWCVSCGCLHTILVCVVRNACCVCCASFCGWEYFEL